MKSQLMVLLMLATVAIVFSGCSRGQQGAAAGAGLGALGGAIIGHQSGQAETGALIGAGAGALGGYVIGNEVDKYETGGSRGMGGGYRQPPPPPPPQYDYRDPRYRDNY